MVDNNRLVSEFCELVSITSPSRGEREIAEVIKTKLGALGCEVFEDDVATKLGGNCGNIYGYLKGNAAAPVLMLSAHMDSVEPCAGIKPQIQDGVIRSNGDTVLGADDKAGIAGVLEALRIVREQNYPHGDVQVVFTVAEEAGLSGSSCMNKELLKADLGYILDSGGSPGKIINAAPGQNNIRAVIHGKAAHAGFAPEEGANAIVIAAKAIAALRQGRIDWETTANVGIIKGGHATNIVPDRVEVVCEARSRNRDKLAVQTRHMVETFESVVKENGGRAEVDVQQIYQSYTLASDMPVIKIACAAAESIGIEPVLEGTGGGSDANYFNVFGVPSAVLGVGMTKVHTTEESILVKDLVQTAELIVAIIRHVADKVG